MRGRSLLGLLVMLSGLLSPPSPLSQAGALELYGTFHAMGIIVTVGANDDPDQDGVASVAYRISGSGNPYRQGYPLSRISDTGFVGSIFWMEPGKTYDVRVSLSDPDGGPLNGLIMESTASTRSEIVIPEPAKSYYVSPTGSGAVCSIDAPCSLMEGLSQAGPGGEVVLRGGIYYQGRIDLPHSGTPGAPIVIRSYEGESAVLDGADPATFTWSGQGGGVYRTTVNVAAPHLLAADGKRLYPYQSLGDLQNLRWGIPGFYADGTAVYVRLAGNADPNRAVVVVSRHQYAFEVKQDYIYLLNLTFRHYGQGRAAKAIDFDNASDNLVQGCTFAINDTGLVLKQESHRNVIQDNEFYDTIFTWSWDAVKTEENLETGGVRFGSQTTGRGNVIRRNVFHDYFDGFSACPSETAGVTNETDVYQNLVHNVGDDGMEADGQCGNVRIWSNTFHDVLDGISLAPAYVGPVYAIRNLIYRVGAGNSSYSGTSFKMSSNGGQSGPMYLFHNTADAVLADGYGLDINQPGTWKLLYARNNIWVGTKYALHKSLSSQSADLDYDGLWNTDSGDLAQWDGTYYPTLAELAAATGQEEHGLDVSPGFADAARGNYALEATSELIDAGLVIPGINDDYMGFAPDMGAFEYNVRGFALTTNPRSSSLFPGGVATYTIKLRPTGGFTSTVTLMAANPSPSLTLTLAPASILPPAIAVLAITSTHSGSNIMPGLWYSIPIIVSGGDFSQTTSVRLLVGGARIYLPLILQGHPYPHGGLTRESQRVLGGDSVTPSLMVGLGMAIFTAAVWLLSVGHVYRRVATVLDRLKKAPTGKTG